MLRINLAISDLVRMASPKQHVRLRPDFVTLWPEVVRSLHLPRQAPQQEVERRPTNEIQIDEIVFFFNLIKLSVL